MSLPSIPETCFIFDGYDYRDALKGLSKGTKKQESLIKLIKKIDEEIQVRREEKQAKEGALVKSE